MFRTVGQRPVLAVLVAAVGISFSGILFRLSHVSSSTGAFYRCVWALPPLFVLARIEDRRYGKRESRAVLLAWLAGAFFAAALLGERPERSSLAAIPIVGFGVVLISGALEQRAYGSNPRLGAVYGVLTGIAYAGFLLALRQGSKDLRRPAGPLFTA